MTWRHETRPQASFCAIENKKSVQGWDQVYSTPCYQWHFNFLVQPMNWIWRNWVAYKREEKCLFTRPTLSEVLHGGLLSCHSCAGEERQETLIVIQLQCPLAQLRLRVNKNNILRINSKHFPYKNAWIREWIRITSTFCFLRKMSVVQDMRIRYNIFPGVHTNDKLHTSINLSIH